MSISRNVYDCLVEKGGYSVDAIQLNNFISGLSDEDYRDLQDALINNDEYTVYKIVADVVEHPQN